MHIMVKGLPSVPQLVNNRAWNAGKEPSLCACTHTSVLCLSLSAPSSELSEFSHSVVPVVLSVYFSVSLSLSLYHFLNFNSYCLSPGRL